MQWLIDMAKDAMQSVLDDYFSFTTRVPGVGPAKGVADFTQDTNWHTIDMSAFIPSGSKVALLQIAVGAAGAGPIFWIDRTTETNEFTPFTIKVQTPWESYNDQFLLDVSGGRELRYKITAGTFTWIYLEVLGSFK